MDDLINISLHYCWRIIIAAIIVREQGFNLEKSIQNDLVLIITIALLEVVYDISNILSRLLLLLLLVMKLLGLLRCGDLNRVHNVLLNLLRLMKLLRVLEMLVLVLLLRKLLLEFSLFFEAFPHDFC